MCFLRGALILAGIFALVGVGFASLAAFVLLAGVHEYVDESGGWGALDYSEAERFVDLLADSGIGASTLDPTDPLLAERVIVVTEAMNERTARHVSERLLYLDALDSTTPIEMRLASSGGWLDASFVIIDTMRGVRAPVNVTAIGGCYWAGTVVLAAATGRRRATPGAMLSIHVNDYDPGDEFDPDTRELARFRDIYARYTDAPLEWFEPRQGDHQYYLSPEQALDLGLIDQIAEPAWEAPPAPDEAPAAGRAA